MATLPFDWNVVIVGAWNEAILTPDGIRKRLFALPEGTPVDVQVAIDRPAPARVHHNGLTVIPSSSALTISVDVCDSNSMKRACEVGINALQSLPETPLSAAGINFRYRIEQLPDELLGLIEASLDEKFSDSAYEIKRRRIARSVQQQPGEINIDISQEQTTEGKLLLNFHLEGQDVEGIKNWLARAEEFFAKTHELLALMQIPEPVEESV